VNEPDAAQGLSEKATSGAAWQGISGLLVRLLRAFVFLALARLVAPADFGVVALAMVFATILQFFSGVGFSNAIIQQPVLRQAHLDTALYVNLAVGLVLSGGLAASAGLVGALSGQPEVVPILWTLSIMPVLTGVSMVPEGLLARNMQFRTTSIRHLSACLLSVAVALILAVAGFGPWALVAQTITEAVAAIAIISYASRRMYRPGLSFSMDALRELLPIGGKMLGQSVTSQISQRADDFLIGSVLGPFQLGLYSVAYRLLTVLQDSLIGVGLVVAFPLFSRLQDDPERLTRGFFRVARLLLASTGAIFVFIAVASREVVLVMLGPTWSEAAPVMSVLAISGVASSIGSINILFLQSIGAAGRALVLSVVAAAVDVIAFAAAVRFGIIWVACAFAIRSALFVPISTAMTANRVGGVGRVLREQLPVLASLVVPTLFGLLSTVLAPLAGDPIALAIAIVVGIPTYLLTLRLVARSVYLDAMSIIKRLFGNFKRKSMELTV
jgi:O-antigen/teichoic acid export membrane protein